MKRFFYKIFAAFIITTLVCVPLLGCGIVMTENQMEDFSSQIGEEIKQQVNEQVSEKVDEALDELGDMLSISDTDDASLVWNFPFFPMSSVSQPFAGTEYDEDCYHLGADIPKPEGTAVKAIFEGHCY